MLRRLSNRFHIKNLSQNDAGNLTCTKSVVDHVALRTIQFVAFVHRGIFKMSTLETLKFDNLVLRSLPIDAEEENFVRQVPGACFSKVLPTPVAKPQLVAASLPALELLNIPESEVERADFAEYFSGNRLLPGSQTASHCYCGHQFGYFSGQLGDGAAIYLGEVINKDGVRWEIQLKGAGLTPYSRSADGRKVLRSTIREFLCSEARKSDGRTGIRHPGMATSPTELPDSTCQVPVTLFLPTMKSHTRLTNRATTSQELWELAIHNLGIPTTRAGSCITSDSTVIRDVFYTGNAIKERCSVVLRIAPTFLRFGSFEIFKPTDSETGRKGPSVGRSDILIQMLDYTIKTFYPEIWSQHTEGEDKENLYVKFFREVVLRTARLVAGWQCVGWCHGVLNTDNMSIVGVTIDYGPYGFMDKYNPDFICNSSDDGGRYTYQKQPEICKWNCKKLAEAIKDAVPLSKTTPELELFDEEFSKCYTSQMRKKLGLLKESLEEDGKLVETFLDTMHKTGADFTNCFRSLSKVPLPGTPNYESSISEVMEYILSQCATVKEMKLACKPQMDPRQFQMFMMLMQTNPGILPALGRGFAALGQEMERLEKAKELENMTEGDKRKEDTSLWTEWFNMYKQRLEQEAQKSSNLEEDNGERIRVMNNSNPRFILRNWIAQNAIEAAEKGDFSEVKRVLKILQNPFSDDIDFSEESLSSGKNTGVKSESGIEEGAQSSSSVDKMDKKSCDPRSFTGQLYDGKPPDWALDLRVS